MSAELLQRTVDARLVATEQAVLAAMAEDSEVFDAVIGDGVGPDHFALAFHGRCCRQLDEHYQEHGGPCAPLDILQRADIDISPSPAALVGTPHLLRIAVKALKAAKHERDVRDLVRRANAAAMRGDMAESKLLLDQAHALEPERESVFDIHSTAQIFELLPPTLWRIAGLQLAPGRPSMFAAYGASGKSLIAQVIALTSAAGRPAFDHFEAAAPMRVLHIDGEQGGHASRKRYQRLAIGLGLDLADLADRLQLAVFPALALDAPGALDLLVRMIEETGAQLVIIDSLKALTPHTDENDSAIRRCLDVLTMASERTGAAFIVLHHAGKPKDGHQSDPRTLLRGSSAIFDACGSVFVIIAPADDTKPRVVHQVKQPADAEGSKVESFGLRIVDVTHDGNPAAGLRVEYVPLERETADKQSAQQSAQRAERILEVLRRNPGLGQNEILERVPGKTEYLARALKALIEGGRVRVSPIGTKRCHFLV